MGWIGEKPMKTSPAEGRVGVSGLFGGPWPRGTPRETNIWAFTSQLVGSVTEKSSASPPAVFLRNLRCPPLPAIFKTVVATQLSAESSFKTYQVLVKVDLRIEDLSSNDRLLVDTSMTMMVDKDDCNDDIVGKGDDFEKNSNNFWTYVTTATIDRIFSSTLTTTTTFSTTRTTTLKLKRISVTVK